MFKTKLIVASLFCLASGSVALADKHGHWQFVSGSAIHFESESLEHSLETTSTGFIRRSTDIVELAGDLKGRAVFQPVSVVDLVQGKMVNTGQQVFSGTVLGSEPVILHDDDFRFDVNLNNGATTGEIYLTGRVSGPAIRCILQMQGTGRTAEGYNLSNYWGQCKLK